MFRSRSIAITMCIAAMSAQGIAETGGEGSLQAPRAMEGIEIVDKPGSRIPMDVQLTNQDGVTHPLGYYFPSGATLPVILIPNYNGCPMLCNLVLNGLVDGMKGLSLKVGKDFRVLSVSIDPKETPDLAKAKRANYLKSMGLSESIGDGWVSNLSNEADINRLTDALGFKYRWDAASAQYVHGAGIFVVSPEGVLSRTLYGISFRSSDLKFALMEASAGRVGSFVDRVILSCFHYEPDKHKYGVYIMGVMRLGGILTVILLGGMLLIFWRRERQQRLGH